MQETRRETSQSHDFAARISEAIADATDRDVLAIAPLYNTIDPDALNRLFDGKQTTGTVVFTHADCHVTVAADGQISVSRTD